MACTTKAASPIYLCERILRGLLAAGGAALFLGFSAISSGAAPMPSEREADEACTDDRQPAETRQGVQDAYEVLMSARLASFYNPGADAEYAYARDALSDESFVLGNTYLDDVWVHMRQYAFENVGNPRVH